MREGLWGCIAAGAVIPGMTVVSGRRRPHAARRSRLVRKQVGQRTTEAEVVVSLVVAAALAPWDSRRADRTCRRLNEAWRPRRGSRPRLGVDDLRRVCGAVRAARIRWASLEPGASYQARWSLPPPEVSPRLAKRCG